MLSIDEIAHLMYTVRMDIRKANGGKEAYAWEVVGRATQRQYQKLTQCDSAKDLAKAENKTSWHHLPQQHKIEYAAMASLILFFRA